MLEFVKSSLLKIIYNTNPTYQLKKCYVTPSGCVHTTPNHDREEDTASVFTYLLLIPSIVTMSSSVSSSIGPKSGHSECLLVAC